MRFLLDVCAASRRLHRVLTDLGHDVLSAVEIDPQAADEALLALAFQHQRVLITEDKDFGELVFLRRAPHPCIVRFVEMTVAEKVSAMRDLIERHSEEMSAGAVIVVTPTRVRIRSRNRIGRSDRN